MKIVERKWGAGECYVRRAAVKRWLEGQSRRICVSAASGNASLIVSVIHYFFAFTVLLSQKGHRMRCPTNILFKIFLYGLTETHERPRGDVEGHISRVALLLRSKFGLITVDPVKSGYGIVTVPAGIGPAVNNLHHAKLQARQNARAVPRRFSSELALSERK